jgi:uncharacterized surface protein with fasciclin (FAS1) repeats
MPRDRNEGPAQYRPATHREEDMRRRHTRWLALLAAVASLSLVAAACSSDDDSTGGESAAPSAPAQADEETITEIVAGNEDFSTLLAAVEAADLGETLSGEGPFTVFAPTVEAFASLPEGTLDELLLPENKDQLASILTYHVVPAEVPASAVESGEVTTVNGQIITIDATDDGVTITDANGDDATVTATDIFASNGVIHVIDSVLLPTG